MKVNIAGIRFRRAGKMYDFTYNGIDNLKIGDMVVVETDRGNSLAKVYSFKYEDTEKYKNIPLKNIIRIATPKELGCGKLSEERAFSFTKKKVEELHLDMKLLKADVQFDGNRVIIYFTANGRVDFRELVKQLASGLKTRVELKQVGVRDETKILSGCGICGKEYCCSSWLCEFSPVSIKMAKNQNLALNPSKVSGACGRILCCLAYEDESYSESKKKAIYKDSKVKLPDDKVVTVTKYNVLKQTVTVIDDGVSKEYPVDDVVVVKKSKTQDTGETWQEPSKDFEEVSRSIEGGKDDESLID